jgi:acetaldehyde dehydrogenase (acetylating)
MDNDVKFVSLLWKLLWHLCSTKLRFMSSYKPQSDPVERANQQVLEALREAVGTVAQYDKWDDALPHVTSRLNTHMSVTTKVSPFEFAHGFCTCVPLTIELPDPATSTDAI